MTTPIHRPAWTEAIDLASSRLGASTLACSDDFFAAMSNLLKPEPPVFIPGKYTPRGKWMDGWESRRKRVPGHDWCIVQLGRPGSIRGVTVDTAHFNGNQPEFCTIEAAELAAPSTKSSKRSAINWSRVEWTELVPRTPLGPGSAHFIEPYTELEDHRFTHVRLNIFPDGGVARLRIHGAVRADWPAFIKSRKLLDLAAAEHGGLVIEASNMHFGSRHNMIMPGRAKNMGDGWETRRKRNLTWLDDRPLESDWAIVKLAHRGIIDSIEVDTNHFKGNFPESCAIETCDAPNAADTAFDARQVAWSWLLSRSRLHASSKHLYRKELDKATVSRPCTHLRLNIFPDGGISRLRVNGRPVP